MLNFLKSYSLTQNTLSRDILILIKFYRRFSNSKLNMAIINRIEIIVVYLSILILEKMCFLGKGII